MFKIGDKVILVEDISDEYKAGIEGTVIDNDAYRVYVDTEVDALCGSHGKWRSMRLFVDQLADLRDLLADAYKRIEELERRIEKLEDRRCW